MGQIPTYIKSKLKMLKPQDINARKYFLKLERLNMNFPAFPDIYHFEILFILACQM